MELRVRYEVSSEPPEVSVSIAPGRPWRCATGRHVLGQVVRADGVRRLYLNAGHVITGHALIYCAVCAQHREWHSGTDALEELFSRRGGSLAAS